MPKYFKDNSTYANRAYQIWLILISKAHNRQVTSYKELAEIIGYKGEGVLAQTLGHIMYYCKDNVLPPLTSLVVNESGLPGSGFAPDINPNIDRQTVFDFKWFEIVPPTPNELKQSYTSNQKKII